MPSCPRRPERLGVPRVFPGRKGDEFLPFGEYRWAFDNACDEVGIGRAGTAPSEAHHGRTGESAGASVKVVQRLLEHATVAMTLDRYGHLLNDDLSGLADAPGKAIDSTAVALPYLEPEAEAELPAK